MLLQLSSLEKAIASLTGALSKTEDEEFMNLFDEITVNCLRAGAIQNFEFTYELSWKFIKRWLDNNIGATYVDGVPRIELFRLAAESQLITDVEQWMTYHRARNKTSHTYDADVAESVYCAARDFLTDAKLLLEALEARNA